MAAPVLCVAFCANERALPGLHTALSSLLKHCAEPLRLEIHLFTQGVNERETAELRATAGGYGERLLFHEADLGLFRSLRSLQGDWMTYHRLLLPKLLPQHRTILYLDADLLMVEFDVLNFLGVEVSGAPLAAGGAGLVLNALEGAFFREIGLTDKDRAFNAGVLLLNAEWWREHDLLSEALTFGKAHPTRLLSADQTILTALYSRTFVALPPPYNLAANPSRKLSDKDAKHTIVHYVGSPKPWDLGGLFLHPNRRFWKRECRLTRFRWGRFLRRHWRSQLAREWTLRRSYARLLLALLRSIFRGPTG